MMDQLVLGEKELASWLQQTHTITSVVRLPGDASARRYYRVETNSKTYIVMLMETFQEQKDSLPFLVIQKHLSTSGVDVPSILNVDPERGFILLEDLGDLTLLKKLQSATTGDTERYLYERVIDSLVRLQTSASPKEGSKDLEAFQLSFDHEKLMWEVNFTIENFYKTYLKRTLSSNDERVLVDSFSEICSLLASQPTVLTHRDFHSRNVMIIPKEGDSEALRFVMIDFQDARMGPRQYDLASLLKDSYYQLEETQISMLLDYYIARYEAATSQVIDRAEFRRVFDLMSVQRNFKAIGSFASFLNKRGDASYLKYIGNTFENIRRQLLKYPEYSELREVLFHYYYF